jgi:hypothetical protein
VGVARRGCRLFWAWTPERLQPEEILLSVTATGASFTRLLAVLLGPKAPAVRDLGGSTLGTMIASSMNTALLSTIGSDTEVKLFDAFGLLDDVVANPTAFGLSDVTNACAQFTPCDPSQYLFWDGIHPTSAADLIISDAIEALATGVPEPPNPRPLSYWVSPLSGWDLLAAAG